jgi:hypothetical protein
VTRADLVATALAVVSLVAGVVVLALGSSFAASLAGACLVGLAGIAFVSLVFLLVGESEDRQYRKGAP